MDALIDQVLETVLRSAIWRTTWYLSFEVLIAVAIIAFLLLAFRRKRRSLNRRGQASNKAGKPKYRYRKKYPD